MTAVVPDISEADWALPWNSEGEAGRRLRACAFTYYEVAPVGVRDVDGASASASPEKNSMGAHRVADELGKRAVQDEGLYGSGTARSR